MKAFNTEVLARFKDRMETGNSGMRIVVERDLERIPATADPWSTHTPTKGVADHNNSTNVRNSTMAGNGTVMGYPIREPTVGDDSNDDIDPDDNLSDSDVSRLKP